VAHAIMRAVRTGPREMAWEMAANDRSAAVTQGERQPAEIG
jgi:hypothetical protein